MAAWRNPDTPYEPRFYPRLIKTIRRVYAPSHRHQKSHPVPAEPSPPADPLTIESVAEPANQLQTVCGTFVVTEDATTQ